MKPYTRVLYRSATGQWYNNMGTIVDVFGSTGADRPGNYYVCIHNNCVIDCVPVEKE